jgi:hypothetical protein
LGGYATGTLTPEEQETLFAAALEDQELFDSLAREQAMRDLLRDPGARAAALAALDRPAQGWFGSWWRPAALAAVSIAAAAILFVALPGRPKHVDLLAVAREPAPPAPPSALVPPAGNQPAQPSAVSEGQIRRLDRTEAKAEARAKIATQAEAPAKPSSVGIGGAIGGVPPIASSGNSAPLLVPTAPVIPAPPATAAPQTAADAVPPVKKEAASPNAVLAFGRDQVKATNEVGARTLFLRNVAAFSQGFAKDSAAVSQQQVQTPQQSQQSQEPSSQSQQLTRQAENKALGRLGAGQRNAVAALNGKRAATAPAGPVGVRYTVAAGEPRSVRFEANAVGWLVVWARSGAGAWRTVQSAAVSPLMPVVVQPAAQENDLTVWFSRNPRTAIPSEPSSSEAASAAVPRIEGPGAGDPATYAASASPLENEIRFNITLK